LKDPYGELVPFELSEDENHNTSIILLPEHEGTYKITGLNAGKEFEIHLFVLDEPNYLKMFKINNYDELNLIENPFIIQFLNPNLDIDIYGIFYLNLRNLF